MGILTEIARYGLRIKFGMKNKYKFTYTDFDRKRKEPYFLIFNHAQLNDSLFIGMYLRYYPYPVASNVLYTNKLAKFGLTKLVKSIPKRKGQSDARTIRMILNTFNKENRGIMIAPEGNSSFYGNETPTDYLPTAKLIKKLDRDLVIAKIDGGYFGHPRWGNNRKRSVIEVEYKPLIKKGEYNQYTDEEVAKIMEDAIKFDDYKWIENRDYIYKDKDLAEGIDNIIYACPKCGMIHTITAKGNDILCNHCGKIAHLNERQFIEGLKFNKLYDWQAYQVKQLVKYLDDSYQSSGKLYELDLINETRDFKGDYECELKDMIFTLRNEAHTYTFDINQISGATITQRNKLSFDYGKYTYLFKMNSSMLFHDLILKKKGEL